MSDVMTYPPGFRGSLWSLRRNSGRNPIAFLEGLAAYPDDVVPFVLAGQRTFLLKHPAFVEAVLVSHHQKFIKAYGLQRAARLVGNGLLTAEGERHRQQRKTVQPAFHRQRLEGYADVMVARAVGLRERWNHEQIIDLASEMSGLTLAIVGKALFGVEVESMAADVRQALTTAIDSLDPLISLLAPMRRVRPQRRRLAAMIDGLIVQHRLADDGRENLLSLLLEGQESGPHTITDQLRDDALTIFLAGHDTIANALAWTWILLAQHPDAEERMQREVDATLGNRHAIAADVSALTFTGHVFAESLRLYPPAWVLARRAIEDDELGGVRIPSGSVVLASQYLIHRDARFFPNPLVFDPDRWTGDRQAQRPKMAYFPFGAGPRVCIGEGFAGMEGVLLLATLAQEWRFRLADGESVDTDPRITLRPRQGVRMVLERRTSGG